LNTYKTLSGKSEAQYRVLGSRHLGFAFHVRTESEIKEIIDGLWKENHNATHVCYAWRLGWDKQHYRINDDGEPSGTAGKPIFGQIQSFDLTNVLIAVVRYYGGTKLGTGGLIDAYKTTARLSIEAGDIIEKPVMDHYTLHFSYQDMPAVMKLLKELEMEKLNATFENDCTIEFLMRMDNQKRLETFIEELSSGKLVHLGRA
jgi:uncharacterized YigZ family protein